MCAESIKNEETIYHEAISKPPKERKAYIEAACGDDTELMARIEALLKAREVKDSFLETPALDPDIKLDESAISETPGTVIGRYKLLEKIGEGGMAVVYMAEQEKPIRRKVALKIIKSGMDTKSVIARFQAERQALAMMEHPNIAKVLDAGATGTGRPYFVMELVRGTSITEYCDQNRLTTQERLALFIQVCQAVQHAHQKSIIHRDIKPSNVMVTLHDGEPVPKVIDFGIAKATNQRLTEKTLFTRYAQMIGTPAYMSPEQAELSDTDVDTRTDIYSLGVLLYELLTGTTPFSEEELRKAGYGEMTRIIREQEPLRPSTCLTHMKASNKSAIQNPQSKIDKDLDWIVMKTLEKDRNRRYSSTGELATDIQRHLNNEPVLAGPPGILYKTGKFIRRHRGFVISLVAVVIAVGAGLVGIAVFAIRADRARDEATVVLRFVEKDIFGTLDPWCDAERNVGVEDLLGMAVQRIQAGTYANKPLVEAAIHRIVGSCFLRLGKFKKAEHHLTCASEIYRSRRDKYDPDRLATRRELGCLYFFWNRLPEAESILSSALKGTRYVLGDRHPETLHCMLFLGSTHMHLGAYNKADVLLSEAVETARQLGPDYQDTGWYMCVLGSLRENQNRLKEAEALFTDALYQRQYGPHQILSPGTSHRIHFQSSLTYVYRKMKRYEEAESLAQKTYQEAIESLGPAHRETIHAMEALARIFLAQKRSSEAEQIMLKAVSIRQSHETTEPDWRTPRLVLAQFYAWQGLHEKMDEQVTAYLEEYGSDYNSDRRERVLFTNDLAWTLATSPKDKVRNGARAVEYATRACEWAQWRNSEFIDTLAAAYAEVGDFNEAVKQQERAIELFRDTHSKSDVPKKYEKRLKLYRSGKPFHRKRPPKDDKALNVGE